MAIPLLEDLDLCGKDLTADALLTQRKLADYLVDTRKAHYHFTVKANQPSLLADLVLFFNDRKQPDSVTHNPPDHGRIETRKIWTTTELNGYLNFPYVGQAFVIERIVINKKNRQNFPRAGLWYYQPFSWTGFPPALARNQPRPLDHRKLLPLCARLGLR